MEEEEKEEEEVIKLVIQVMMITTHGDQATWFTHYASDEYAGGTVPTSPAVQTTQTEMICRFFLSSSKY
jgi:hypothetical protein